MAAEDDVDSIDAAIAALRSKLEQATAGERRAQLLAAVERGHQFSDRGAEHAQRYVALARH
jgi:hypothetical protein